jgi:ubiquinone/menaquinone biosynthesis C-methylase UbiE
MYTPVLPILRCTRCGAAGLVSATEALACPACGASFPIRKGILDTVEGGPEQVITPFQRLMQSPPVVSIYEKFWRQAGYFVASSRSFARELDTVCRLAAGKTGMRALDLACGPGVFTRPLAAQSSGVFLGLDLSWPMLRRARHMVERSAVRNILLVRGTAFCLPFADRSFHLVNCCGALHLFDSPEKALGEIARVLAPGGHLTVQTTIRPAHSAGTAYLLERFVRFGFFDQSQLDEKICQNGFKILESERHRISYTFLARYLS